jgi:hypothetical protein
VSLVPLSPLDKQWIIIVAIVTIDANGAIDAIVTMGEPPMMPVDHHWRQWR